MNEVSKYVIEATPPVMEVRQIHELGGKIVTRYQKLPPVLVFLRVKEKQVNRTEAIK